MSSNAPVRTYSVALEPLSEQRLADFAVAAGLSVEEALSTVLQLGLEAGEARTTVRDAQLEDIVRELRDLKLAVHVLGPSAMGAGALLAHWVAKANGGMSEDEFLATFEDSAQNEWGLAMAKAGIVVPNGAIQGAAGE